MRKQIESLDPYFGTISLAWLQEESDYRKVRSEKGNKKITIERFFIGNNSAQINFTVGARRGGLWNLDGMNYQVVLYNRGSFH